ncbi:VWA domain-containing protein [Meiothermus sp. QL-1]|uniref:vWA domain-containing protein n=1 Tax=Meiothermus sp. QL-1 TaxID=2058095 RepID=UPI000E0AD668|nr:VWA domain-containing protein [Meiothermus sp. QL-1]RDI94663.1 VWA domain-containing protein [Meiothermus sp. QL-1]
MTSLLSHVVAFARALRREGIPVTPGQAAAFARALGEIAIFDPESFFFAARCTLVTRREDLARFDEVFRRFWKALGLEGFPAELLHQTPLPPKNPKARPGEVGRSPQTTPSTDGPPQPLVDRALTFSELEVLRQKRFDQMSEAELEAARRLIQGLAWTPPERRSRRMRPMGQEQPDLRRSLRRALRHQGEVLSLAWRSRKRKPRPIVALADVSGSMERYARMLLQFLHAFAWAETRRGVRRVEVFTFGTRLTRITRSIKKRDANTALAEVGREVKDWSGGTRIGACLHTFNHTWGKRVLGQGAIVLIISDGWDQGDPELLAFEMERLQKSCHRLVWLNPLLGTPGYRPLTRGLVAALPYVDHFLPIHNLSSLEMLAEALEGL